MNILTRSFENLFTFEKRSVTESSQWLTSLFPISQTEGAKKVNVHTSLTISAFYCAVNTIANSYALLPHGSYQKKDNKRTHLTDHPADYLLTRQPNNYHTAFNFRKIMMIAVLLRGNAYAYIERNNAGDVVALHYLHPDDVNVRDYNRKLFYNYKGNRYNADEIIHVAGFSENGISGRSVIQYAADQLGVTLAAQKFGSESLHNRGISHGVLETDKSIDKNDQKRKLSTAFSNALSENDHRSAILDEGMKYKPLALKPADAQFIETYAKGSEDVGRWFQIPNHKLGVPGEGGYNYIVELEIDYIRRAVMPHAEAFKQELERKIYTPSEIKDGLYIHQNYNKLLQADPKSRAQFYKDLYYLGAINANEIRSLEDMDPRDDKYGEEFVLMSNVLNELQLKKQLNETTNSNTDE